MDVRRIVPAALIVAVLALGAVPAGAASPDYITLSVNVSQDSSSKVATTESKSYNLLPGRPSWAAGPTVEYRVQDAPSAAAASAVDAAASTLDPYVTTRAFAHNDGTTQVNPCTGQPNLVRWGPVDGPGGLLAQSILCINKAHEIVGFQTTFDTADPWATDGSGAAFDVQAVAVHEWGHLAGLDVVDKPGDACLTMYFRTRPGDTEQRTLGLGDKLGLDKLYNTGDTSPGPGCGL